MNQQHSNLLSLVEDLKRLYTNPLLHKLISDALKEEEYVSYTHNFIEEGLKEHSYGDVSDEWNDSEESPDDIG